MPFLDASFELVYPHSVFVYLPDPAAALAEMRRVLRPGGIGFVMLGVNISVIWRQSPPTSTSR